MSAALPPVLASFSLVLALGALPACNSHGKRHRFLEDPPPPPPRIQDDLPHLAEPPTPPLPPRQPEPPPPPPLPPPRPRHVEPRPAVKIPCGPGKGPRYDVQGVAADDVLNVRVSPGAASEVIGKLAPNTLNVLDLGDRKQIGKTEWRKVRCNGVSGWVNSNFLSEARAD